MRKIAIGLFGALLLLFGSPPAFGYVWRCHTPAGDIWTSQPNPADDCEEYDSVFNPGAAPAPMPVAPYQTMPPSLLPPPAVQNAPLQVLPLPPPPVVIAPPLYSRYYYDPYYWPGGPGLYISPPALVFRFGPHGHHWR